MGEGAAARPQLVREPVPSLGPQDVAGTQRASQTSEVCFRGQGTSPSSLFSVSMAVWRRGPCVCMCVSANVGMHMCVHEPALVLVCEHGAPHLCVCACVRASGCMCMRVYARTCAVPQAGAPTSAGLLLGTEGVALIAEAGVGARQVLAACLPAGARVRTFIYVCKENHRCDRSCFRLQAQAGQQGARNLPPWPLG